MNRSTGENMTADATCYEHCRYRLVLAALWRRP
jgi:hypothetical protein